jgi:succinate dehydrogenase flavin-adding protein (antitoxin of CptAB toxin-antitoxin module)
MVAYTAKALTDIGQTKTELNQNKQYISIRDAEGNSTTIGDTSGRFVNRDYGQAELERLGNAYGTLLKVQAPTVQFALSTVKFRNKPPKQFDSIKSLGKFLDKQTKVTDPLNDAAYNRALDAADKEIKYQLKKADTGEGWYDADVVKMFEQLQEKIPSLENQFNKDLFTALIGITSPQANPRDNVVRAARIYSYYDKFGALPLKQPSDTNKYFGRTTIAQQMGLLQYLLDTKGKEGTVDFLNSLHEVRDLDKVIREAGKAKYGSQFTDKNGRPLNYSQTSKVSGVERPRNERNDVLGSYIFGNKVGSFYLNIQGIADKEGDAVTKDLWAARSFYRQFGQVVDNTKSAEQGLKGAFTGPHKKRGDAFFVELGKRNNLSPKDAQAVLWYYEHELFGELGIKNVPALYLSQGSKKYIDNFDKGKKYGTIELENRQPSVEITNRVVQEKTTEEETELSVSNRRNPKTNRRWRSTSVFTECIRKNRKKLGFPPIMKKGNQNVY